MAFDSDGNTTFIAGQDASKDPDKIGPNNYYAGINVINEFGSIIPRWGIRSHELNHAEGGLTLKTGLKKDFASIFSSGRFQLAEAYSIGQEFYLIIVINGIIYLINQDTLEVEVLEITDGSTLNPNAVRLNSSPSGKFFTIFDYPNRPVIIENREARRSDPDEYEVPISRLGAFNETRLFIVNGGNEFTAGDPTGTAALPNAPITFEEVLAPSAPFVNQIFQLSTNYGNDPITALAFLQFTDSSTGIGPLLVSTANMINSYQTQKERVDWENGQFGSNFIFNTGIAGQKSFINVNSDIFFTSSEGEIHTAAMSRDEQGKWSKTPVSREVENWIVYQDKSYAKYVSMGYFRNKIFTTVNPILVEARDINSNAILDLCFQGFVVLDSANVATLSEQNPPCWSGLWTGIRPMAVIKNNNRLFVVAKDPDFKNTLYEFIPNQTYDFIHGYMRYITGKLYTREYDHKTPLSNKELHSINVSLNDLKGQFSMKIRYKPSHGANFIEWADFQHEAPYKTCFMPTDEQLQGFAAHNFKDLTFGNPKEKRCDPITNEPYDVYNKIQVYLELRGYDWRLSTLKVNANLLPQSDLVDPCKTNPFEVFMDCNNDWKVEEINLCQLKKM